MKIVQVGQFPQNINYVQGGIEASVWGLSCALSKKNHQVSVIDFPRSEYTEDHIETFNTLKVYRFKKHGKSNLSAIKSVSRIIKTIRQIEPDICHFHSTNLLVLLLYLRSRSKKCKCMLTVHGLVHVEKKKQLKSEFSLKVYFQYLFQSFVEFWLLNLIPKIIVDTEYVNNQIVKYYKEFKIIHSPIRYVIPQGINNEFFKLNTDRTDENLLFSVGAISPRKGHLMLIRAMAEVVKVFPKLKLVIAGLLTDSEYMELLDQEINELELSENVTIYPNMKFEELKDHFEKMKLFVLHSQEESQGIVFCEAMASGKPVIATNAGGIPWIIKYNYNGLLSDYGDITIFSNHIIWLLKDKTLYEAISRHNTDTSQQYNWKNIAEKVLNVYHSI